MRPAVKSRKPKHLMIKLHDDPALEAWTEHCAGLVNEYALEVHGDDERGHELCSFFVHIVGDMVWSTSKPTPCWSRFDVSNWIGLMSASNHWDVPFRASAVLTVFGFYLWLVQRGHLEQEVVSVILCQLHILAEDAMRICERPLAPWDERAERELPN